MSAVLSALATAPTPRLQWRFGPGVEVRALDAIRRDVPAPLADAADAADADAARADPEALLLARCAAQIAAEAGADAVVHAIGAHRQAALLRAAVEALPTSRTSPPERIGAARCIVYLPRRVIADLGADALLATLRRLAALHGEDALLVVAIERAPGHGGSCFDRLAGVAGWELCQLWSDGFARHALHVLERTARAELLRAS